MAHVESNTGEHVIWGSFETKPYHGTLYLSQGEPIPKWTLRKRACTYGPDILVSTMVGSFPISRQYDTEIASLWWHYTIRHVGCILGLLSGDSTWCRCWDWFKTAAAQMSWIKAKYAIPLLELTLIGGWVCVVYTGGIYKFEPGKTGSFYYCWRIFWLQSIYSVFRGGRM
jgi:hypothetical protein